MEHSASDQGNHQGVSATEADPPPHSSSRWGVQAAKRKKRRAMINRSDTTTSSDSAEIDVWSPPEDFRSLVTANAATCWPTTYKVARRASAESLSQAPSATSLPPSSSFNAELEKRLRQTQESSATSQKRGLSIKGSCRRQWLLKQSDKRKFEEDGAKSPGGITRKKDTAKKSTFQL